MANWKVVVSGATELRHDTETPTKERKPDKTPDRRHVNVLLDISEEEFMKDLEPHEYHCYQGWEEAVHGWERVAPLASILLAGKTDHKPKRKDAEQDSSTSVEPEHLAGQPDESQLGPPNSSLRLSQHMWACTNSDISNATSEIPETPVVDGMSKTNLAQLLLDDQTEEIRTPFQHYQVSSKYNVVDNRSSKPPKNSQRTNSALVPIKNFSFLPPINMTNNKQQNSTGKKHPQGESIMENLFIIDKISKIQGTKGDLVYNSELPKDAYNEGVSAKYRTCQHNPHYYSAVSVPVPKRYHVALSSKPETLHPTGYSMSKALRSGTAANRQVHMHPSCLYS